jgi:hypothetical protein
MVLTVVSVNLSHFPSESFPEMELVNLAVGHHTSKSYGGVHVVLH